LFWINSYESAPIILCFKGFGMASFYFRASASGIGSKLLFFLAANAVSRGSEGSG